MLVEPFSGHLWLLWAKTFQKAVYKSWNSWPSYPDTKYQLVKFGFIAQKPKCGFKNFSLFFPFCFPFSSFFRSSWPLFSFAGQVVGSISVGKVFEKVFRILGVWRIEVQVGSGPLWVGFTCFIVAFFSGLAPWLNHDHSGLFWKIYYLLHKLHHNNVKSTRDVDPNKRLRVV